MVHDENMDALAVKWIWAAINRHSEDTTRRTDSARRRAAVVAMLVRRIGNSKVAGARLVPNAAMIRLSYDEMLQGLAELKRLGLLIDDEGKDFRLAFGGVDLECLSPDVAAALGGAGAWDLIAQPDGGDAAVEG
jgi:hypothetical protein